MINPEIFKMYDIRGKYPNDLNEANIPAIIKAYIKLFNPTKIVIGHDSLEGSSILYETVCDTFSNYGIEVHKINMCSSPMLYFASAHYGFNQAIMLTASHLGEGHTGIKIVENGVPPTPEKMLELKNLILESNFELNRSINVAPKTIENFYETYVEYLIKVLGTDNINNKYKVVMDVSNGPNSLIIDRLDTKLGLSPILLNKQILGKNLSHESNPKISENREQLKKEVINKGADFGIIWDGDCDRALFIDDTGTLISPELVGAAIGSYLIEKGLGTTVTIEVRGSKYYEEKIKQVGGNVKRIVSWHVPIKQEMAKDNNIVFGMETSGHFVFRDFYKIDDGLLATLMFLLVINQPTYDYHQQLKELKERYLILEEINFHTQKTESQLVEEFSKIYIDGLSSKIDGYTVDYPDWRFNIRSSRTEPIIRLNISGTNFEKVRENLKMIKEVIGGTEL